MKIVHLGLIATLLICLSGCKSTAPEAGFNEERASETRSAIQASIADPARSAQMLKVMDRFESELDQIGTSIKKIRADIVTANADYATERETLEKMYAQLGEQVRLLGNTFRDRNFELRKLCSAEDWKSIADLNDALVNFVFEGDES